jgi:hypothetical protein
MLTIVLSPLNIWYQGFAVLCAPQDYYSVRTNVSKPITRDSSFQGNNLPGELIYTRRYTVEEPSGIDERWEVTALTFY